MFIEMPKSWSISSKCDIISNLESWNQSKYSSQEVQKLKKKKYQLHIGAFQVAQW